MIPIVRRDFLGALATLLAADFAADRALALGRTPYGGTLRLKIPWPVDSIDPHAIDDATSALFGPAIADTLFALDAQGRPYPALAAKLPEKNKDKGTRITLRPNLQTASGRGLDARDVIFSLTRSARSGGAAVLSTLGTPTHDASDGYACIVPAKDSDAVARALASPVTAILPRGFNRQKPDATGAFTAEPGRTALVLRRNLNAARGAAFLERIEIRKAPDLRDALRSFETGEIDMSWIEQFLHQPRAGAIKLSAGPFGWIVLHTGKDAGAWGAPGVAQRLLDAIPASRIEHLGIRSLGSTGGDPSWGGPPTDLLVPDDAPHLTIVAKELAAILTRPSHDVTALARPRSEIAQRKASGRFTLALGFARRLGASASLTLNALYAAADPALAKHPPKLTLTDPRRIADTLPLGILGELQITGAQIPSFRNLSTWELGAVWRK